eukprot:8175001-Pyramimonas_sp.AAC.1
MTEVKKLSQQQVLIIFVAVSIVAGGAGYATLKFNDAAATSARLTAEVANLYKEKVVALDMLKERDEEISMYKTSSEKHKEDVEKLTDVMEKQKSAAKKLAEVRCKRKRSCVRLASTFVLNACSRTLCWLLRQLLAKTQKERDTFKSEKDTLSRFEPHCSRNVVRYDACA